MLYEIYFPISVPAFQLFFVVDSVFNRRVFLKPNEFGQFVPFGESRSLNFAVSVNATNQIGGNTDVECAEGFVGQDVCVAAFFHELNYGWV